MDTDSSGAAVEQLDEPREASGLTTRLVLDFVEREGGNEAVDAVLGVAGMSGLEDELRDENRWFADQTRIRLFEAAAEVLDDAQVGRRIGATAIDSNVGQALKLSLRALGSPRLIYSNVGRANAKFNRVHRMDVLEIDSNHARVSNVPIDGASWHQCDCDYNIGLLSCAPMVFGESPARVRHSSCIGTGADACIYEVEWSSRRRTAMVAALTGSALAALIVSAFLAPSTLPAVIVAASVVAAYSAARVTVERRMRWRLLHQQVREQAENTDLLMASMQDLVSALELDDVLSKITANARSAVGGADFALLVEEPAGLRCRSSSNLPRATIEALEAWAGSDLEQPREPTLIDDLGTVRALSSLPEDDEAPRGSLCVAPLSYHDRSLGMLVALASSPAGFLPRDVELLSSYAAQAAIALANATLYAAQQDLAARDPLTGLFNHRHFHETIERELESCRRHGGELGIVLCDLDGFKAVNDTGGHAEGDDVLRRVAAALQEGCRRSDLAFRIGGDEFALVLPDTDSAAAETAAKRACEAIAAADRRTTVSYGASSWPDGGPTKDALLAAADDNLYEMKRSRKSGNPIVVGDGRGAGKHHGLACASRIAVRLAPLLDEDQIVRVAVDELHGSFGYRGTAIHRTKPGADPILVAGAGAFCADPSDRATSRAEHAASARAAHRGEAVLVNDLSNAVHGDGSGAGSELATPIRVDGKPWGVLALTHADTDAFDFDDLLFADTIAAAVGAAIHRVALYSELEGTFMRTLAVLSDALEAKDSYTAAHAREVADLADEVAEGLRLGAAERRRLSYGALLHDIGKIAIRSEILHKPGPLTDQEYEEMKAHTVVGAQMLERIPYFAEVHPLVRASHERWDGTGYPEGLTGEMIPLGARIIAACDAFHAMTSDRPYRDAMDPEAAVAELRRHAGSQFDPAVIDALVKVIGEGGEPILQPALAPTAQAAR